LIVCKKCGGAHLTIKCGKEIKPIEIVKKVNFNKNKTVTVKLSNLPDDITQYELEYLMKDWGSISRVNLSSYENKTGFIDFYTKSEADYFIEAIDRTAFDHLIIRAEYIENKY
jgi:RNA recognition motif-containing protein